jgi:hypothetical protein
MPNRIDRGLGIEIVLQRRKVDAATGEGDETG